MSTVKDLICFNCKHKNDYSTGCKAFKNGIPDEIILSNLHDKPLPNQGNDLVFEKLDLSDL